MHQLIENMFTLDLPIWIGVFVSSYFYIKVLRFLRSEAKSMYKVFFYRLRLYPIVLFVSWIPLTIQKLYTLFYGYSFPLLCFQFLLTHLQGFSNAMVYGYYHGVSIKELCGGSDPMKMSEATDYEDNEKENKSQDNESQNGNVNNELNSSRNSSVSESNLNKALVA